MIPRCSRIAYRVSSTTRCRRSAFRPSSCPARRRSFASHTAAHDVSSTTSSPLGPLTGLASELDKLAPRFEVDAQDVQILREPKDFFEELKTKILSAKRRIYLSTLYVGKTEHELIATLRSALQATPTLKVSILTDALRGTREEPKPSCASLLVPLVDEFGAERVEIRMFHTPNLVGLRKRFLPKRINEGWGLQHMKLYGIDDEIIMSGANLSEDYFTNRQDRYHVLRSAALADYYARIHNAVCSISFLVKPSSSPSSFVLSWPDSNPAPNPLDDSTAYIAASARLLAPLINPTIAPRQTSPTKTYIYPVLQLTPLFRSQADPSTELPALTCLLAALRTAPLSPNTWTFTAGYFNMTPFTRDMLLSTLSPNHPATISSSSPSSSATQGTIVTAHPHANGFFGSKGVSGMLPPAYTLLARRFLQTAQRRGLTNAIALKEWQRGTVGRPDGWTYHAKGIWVTLRGEPGPSISLVGSSNYTLRSHTLDLEANALILTRDQDLQRRLRGEEVHLQTFAKRVGMDEFAREDRKVGLGVRLAMWIVGLVGGAL